MPRLAIATLAALAAIALSVALPAAATTVLDPPVQAAVVDTDGLAFGVAMAGDLAVVCDHGAGVLLVDLADPTAPVVRGGVDTPGFARNVAVPAAWRSWLIGPPASA